MKQARNNRKWRRAKQVIGSILLSGILLFLFRGPLFRLLVSYHLGKEKALVVLTDSDLEASLLKPEALSIEELIALAETITNERLHFSMAKGSQNPNHILQTGKANCIGYASLFAAIFQTLIQAHLQDDQWQVRHLRGQLRFLGIDLHQLTAHPFFQDHDFNSIENVQTGQRIYLDPSVSDYLGIHRIRVLP